MKMPLLNRCCDRAGRKQLPCPPILTPQNTSQAVGHGLLKGQHHIAFKYLCPDQQDEMTTLCIPKEESEGHENALKSFGERDVRAWNPILSFGVGEKERKELGKGKRGGVWGRWRNPLPKAKKQSWLTRATGKRASSHWRFGIKC